MSVLSDGPGASPAKTMMSAMGVCCHCEEQCPPSSMCSWGKNAVCCHVCKTNYNRQTERVKTDTVLKRWWEELAKDERVAWYKRNKATYEPNCRRAFDNPGFLEESSHEAAKDREKTRWEYYALDDWIIRERLLGNTGSGTLQEQRAAATASYEEKILDRTWPKKKVDGMWLTGIFKGVSGEHIKEESRVQSFKRRRTVHDSVDHDAAQELASEGRIAIKQFSEERFKASSHLMAGTTTRPEVDDGLARNPAPLPICRDDFADEIKRDVIMAMKQQSQVANQEDIDDHEARAAQQVAREARRSLGGRPKKQTSQVMAEVARMIRDWVTHVMDAIATMKLQEEDVVKEFKEKQDPLPADLASIADSMVKEVEAAAKVMTAIQ